MGRTMRMGGGPPLSFKLWFAFCALLGLSQLAAIVYGVYLLFVHFGVIA